MENNELKELVEVFTGYRDSLMPLQKSIHGFAESYDGLKTDLEKISELFGSDINGKLDNIYKTLSSQAQKSTDLSSRVDAFVTKSNKFINDINNMSNLFESVEKKLTSINEIETKAEEQIKKLDGIIEDKKINYNVKDLQKSLENYNVNVQNVSEFINKDVAEKLSENNEKISQIKKENENLKLLMEEQAKSIGELISIFASTNAMLEKTVQKEDINEAYIFDILDRWAYSRKVKIKK